MQDLVLKETSDGVTRKDLPNRHSTFTMRL